MTEYMPASAQEAQVIATGPTINASYTQTCGWCLAEVAAAEPITYTRESGWCHQSCTTRYEGSAGSGRGPT